MLCPACGNDSLQPTEQGTLLCDECGEQVAGYREEEVDFALAGTAVSNRASQSSAARSVRARLTPSVSSRETAPPPRFVDEELLLCEAAFHFCAALAARLFALDLAHPRIRAPLFELLTHWVAARAALPRRAPSTGHPLHPYQLLAMVALALLYDRSPLLPRDLVRLVATRQLPFLDGAKVLPPDVRSSAIVRARFAPRAVPSAREIVRAATALAHGPHAWPPLRAFFVQVPRARGFTAVASFPVGHLTLTLLRLCRLLGLPDAFGARVLRFRELRQIASQMARRFARPPDGASNPAPRVDEADLPHVPSYLLEEHAFSKPLSAKADCHGFPTEESVMIDFINTMRLCYGTRRGAAPLDERDAQLLEEWEGCKDAMERWLRYGGSPEDVDAVSWSCFPPNVLASCKGADVRRFAGIVDDLLSAQRDRVPELWGKFTSVFKEIGSAPVAVDQDDDEDWEFNADNLHVRRERCCMYDPRRCDDQDMFPSAEGRDAMDLECGYDRESGLLPVRPPLRPIPGLQWRKRPRKLPQELEALPAFQRKRFQAKRARALGNMRARRAKDSDDLDQGNDIQEDQESRRGNDNVVLRNSYGSGVPRTGEDVAEQKKKIIGESAVRNSGELASGGRGCADGSENRHKPVPARREGQDDDASEYLDPEMLSFATRGDFLVDPAGIGLALTIVRRFFTGSAVPVMHDDVIHSSGMSKRGEVARIQATLDQSMGIVLLYTIGLEGRTMDWFADNKRESLFTR